MSIDDVRITADSRMVKDKQYTIEFVSQALLKRGLISKEQDKEVLSKGNPRRGNLQKSQESHYSRRHQHVHHVTPPEVISSFNIEMQGKKGKMLTDRMKAVMTDKVALSALYVAAKSDGMLSLRKVDVRKMLEGTTTYEEVIGVTG